jgi:Raf kinase inhibitor-like YbhB/YbcL family protein
MSLTLSSRSFPDGGEIPSRYTCEGDDRSPALSWSGVPAAARSLALIADDPDAPDPAAPRMTYVHWVLANLPATTTGLPEGVTAAALPPGAKVGLNDFGRSGYGGPCPPIGRHRYYFKLYALDIELPGLERFKKPDLEKAMTGHVLESAQLVGTYHKGQR